jgi:hypothetical protein
MKSLNKNNMVMVRMNRDLFKRLTARAKSEAARRGERLPVATLARELIQRGLDQLDAFPAALSDVAVAAGQPA